MINRLKFKLRDELQQKLSNIPITNNQHTKIPIDKEIKYIVEVIYI